MITWLAEAALVAGLAVAVALTITGLVALGQSAYQALLDWRTRRLKQCQGPAEAELEARVAARLRVILAEDAQLEAGRDHVAHEMAKAADRAAQIAQPRT